MKCRAKQVVREREDLALRHSTIEQCFEFFILCAVQFLGDRRGWKEESISRFLKDMIRYAQLLEEDYTTFTEVRSYVWEEYGVKIQEGHIMMEGKNTELWHKRQSNTVKPAEGK